MMLRHPIPRRRAFAFTLLEVMIAMAILTVVVGAIYGTWRAIMGATRVSRVVATEVQQERMALRWLSQSMTYVMWYQANNDLYYIITPNDQDNVLSFVTRLPENFPRSGRFDRVPVRRVEFTLQPGKDGGNDLVLRQRLLTSEDYDQDELEHPFVMMSHVREMETEYYDLQTQDWVTEWPSSNQIPVRLRVTLKLDDKNDKFGQGREVYAEGVPASVGVQSVWQGRAPGQQGQNNQPGIQPPTPRRQ